MAGEVLEEQRRALAAMQDDHLLKEVAKIEQKYEKKQEDDAKRQRDAFKLKSVAMTVGEIGDCLTRAKQAGLSGIYGHISVRLPADFGEQLRQHSPMMQHSFSLDSDEPNLVFFSFYELNPSTLHQYATSFAPVYFQTS